MFIYLSRKAYVVQKVCKIKNNCGCLQHDGLFWSKRRSRGGNCTLTLMRGQNPEYKGSPISKSICDWKWNVQPPTLQYPHFSYFFEQMHVCLWFLPSDLLRDLPLRRTTKNKGSAVSSVATAMSGIISHPVTALGALIKHGICFFGTLKSKI